MVTAEELATLDLLVWLRTGREVGARLGCSQTTVSRRVAHCAAVFRLRLKRVAGEWQHRGAGALLLQMERQVHQCYRLMGGAPLRLEATYWDAHALAQPAPPGWITGMFDHVGMARPLQLLRERVIDAWLASYQPDLPGPEDAELAVFDLSRFPVWLMADRRHPLVAEAGVSLGDLQQFPSLALPEGMLPRFEQVLRAQGLWNTPAPMRRYRPEAWEGRTEDGLTLIVGNTVGHRLSPQLVPLDWDLGLDSGQALVVRRDVADQGAIALLLEQLRYRTACLQAGHPTLEIV